MAPDVLILGADVAGLSAGIALARAGLHVELIEARDRIGGRVFTVLPSKTCFLPEQQRTPLGITPRNLQLKQMQIPRT